MNLWQRYEKANAGACENARASFHFERGTDPDLKREFVRFAAWLRKRYVFPVCLNVYVLDADTVRLLNGTLAYGSFRWFDKRTPRIKIPAAIDKTRLAEDTKEELIEETLSSLVHELTHYFQWCSGIEQSNSTSEWQANYYRYRIIDLYKGTAER